MDIEKIADALRDRNLMRVSEATGLHHNTLVRLRTGETKRLTAGTQKILTDYLFPSA